MVAVTDCSYLIADDADNAADNTNVELFIEQVRCLRSLPISLQYLALEI